MTSTRFVLTDALRSILAAALDLRDTMPEGGWPPDDDNNLGYAYFSKLGGTLADCRCLAEQGLLRVHDRSMWLFRITPAGIATLLQTASEQPVEPGDTEPLEPVSAPVLLTEVQRKALTVADSAHNSLMPAHVLSDDIDELRALVDVGLLVEAPVTWFAITETGRAALAPQPGDGLPESHPPEGGDVLPSPPPALDDDVPPFPEALRDYNVHQMQRFAEERDALETKLADVQTAHDLLRELLSKHVTRLADTEAANASLRETISKLRRDRAEAQLLIDQLQRRVSAPVDDVVYALVPEPKPVKVEVRTLVQNFKNVGADEQLAAYLSEGWNVLHIGLDTGETWSYRIVTLTREVEDDAAGDAPEASASAEPDVTPQAEPASAPDTRLVDWPHRPPPPT